MSAGMRHQGTPEPTHLREGVGKVGIAGDSRGDPSGPLVLLQHGGGQTRHPWKATGELLGSAGYFAVVFDARGHGDSDWAPDGGYGQDVTVEDLERVVAALGKRRPVLVGASMGGGTGLVAVGEDHVGEEGAQDFLKRCPHSEYVSVAHAAHMIAGDRNDTFGSSVIEFLSRAVPPAVMADIRGHRGRRSHHDAQVKWHGYSGC